MIRNAQGVMESNPKLSVALDKSKANPIFRKIDDDEWDMLPGSQDLNG